MSGGNADASADGTDQPEGEEWIPEGHEFVLLLTHDVDRPYKTYQSIYYALADRDPEQLLSLLPGQNPYWTFEDLMALEESLGVRSAFYFLDEQSLFRDRSPSEWLSWEGWQLYAGRYDLEDPAIGDLIQGLDDGGWEVGLHGSYESYDDPDRLAREASRVEEVLGHEILGGRQHYLNMDRPDTWEYQSRAGLRYDCSLGSASEYGFQHGYEPLRPFDDEFVAFPLTLMEVALPDPGEEPDAAMDVCEDLLDEARENGAVMTVLWHPRYFSADFPGYQTTYRRLIERAQELGGWVGSPAELFAELGREDDHPEVTAVAAER